MVIEKDDEHEKTDRLPASARTHEEKAHSISSPSTNLVLALNVAPVVKGRTVDLKAFNLKSTAVEIIRQVCRETSKSPRGTLKKLEQESTGHGRQRQNSEIVADSNAEKDIWGYYLPPVEGHPILMNDNRMQVSRRSLPCVHVMIKCKSVPAVIDPSISLSFICNDLYNIYVQSHFSEEEIRYSEGGRKRENAYCWWSQRRALITRARIALPIKWDTTAAGGVEDVLHLNLIQPNPGLVNGFIVLGKDFYTKYAPLFCIPRNLIAISPSGKRDLTGEMKMHWSVVMDFIPIADRRKGVVYFMDKYEKNRKYCKRYGCRR